MAEEEGEFGFVSRDQGLLDRAAGAPDAEGGEAAAAAAGSTPEELSGGAAGTGSDSAAGNKRGSVTSSTSSTSKGDMEPDPPAAKSSDIPLPQLFQVIKILSIFFRFSRNKK